MLVFVGEAAGERPIGFRRTSSMRPYPWTSRCATTLFSTDYDERKDRLIHVMSFIMLNIAVAYCTKWPASAGRSGVTDVRLQVIIIILC